MDAFCLVGGIDEQPHPASTGRTGAAYFSGCSSLCCLSISVTIEWERSDHGLWWYSIRLLKLNIFFSQLYLVITCFFVFFLYPFEWPCRQHVSCSSRFSLAPRREAVAVLCGSSPHVPSSAEGNRGRQVDDLGDFVNSLNLSLILIKWHINNASPRIDGISRN